jgi:hypothetical protein
MVIAIDRMLDRIIDRCLEWEQRRQARRAARWKRHMYRDSLTGIWCRDPRYGIW